MTIQSTIVKKLFESKHSIETNRVDEAGFDSGGKHYSAAFGHYSCDGKKITCDDYMRARVASKPQVSNEKNKGKTTRTPSNKPQVSNEKNKGKTTRTPSSKSKLSYGQTTEEMEDELLDLEDTIKDANRAIHSKNKNSKKAEAIAEEARRQYNKVAVKLKYAKKGLNPQEAISTVTNDIEKIQSKLSKAQNQMDELKSSHEYKKYKELEAKIPRLPKMPNMFDERSDEYYEYYDYGKSTNLEKRLVDCRDDIEKHQSEIKTLDSEIKILSNKS